MELLEEEHKKATRKAMQLLEHMEPYRKGTAGQAGAEWIFTDGH